MRRLRTNMRANGDNSEQNWWREYLLRIGDGKEPVHTAISPYAVRLPDELVAPKDWTTADLNNLVFPDMVLWPYRSRTRN